MGGYQGSKLQLLSKSERTLGIGLSGISEQQR